MDTRITEDGKGIAALLFERAHVGKMTDLVGSEKLQNLVVLRRAAEVVEMLLDEAEAMRQHAKARVEASDTEWGCVSESRSSERRASRRARAGKIDRFDRRAPNRCPETGGSRNGRGRRTKT